MQCSPRLFFRLLIRRCVCELSGVSVLAYLVGTVLFLRGNVQVFVNFVQEPQQELLRVVLREAPVLRPVLPHNVLEITRDFGLVHPSPQTLQQLGQLLRQFSSRTIFLCVDLVVSLDVQFVVIGDEVFGEQLGVAQTLQNGVHKTRVSVILDAHDAWSEVVLKLEGLSGRFAALSQGAVVERSLGDGPQFASRPGSVNALTSTHSVRNIPHHFVHELPEAGGPGLFLSIQSLSFVELILQSLQLGVVYPFR